MPSLWFFLLAQSDETNYHFVRCPTERSMWQETEGLIAVPMAAVTNYHKLRGLKQQKCIHSILEARSLKSVSLGCNQGVGIAVLPLEVLGENLSLSSSSFWWLPASLDLWLHHSCLRGHMPPPFLCLISLCVSLIMILLMAFRAHPDSPGKFPHLKSLNLIH